MLYFAYGSNMLTERLRARVQSAQPVARARLPDRELRYHKGGQDGSGKCNIVDATTASTHVWGVLFDIASEDLPALDEAEGRGHGYERCRVHPCGPDSVVEAFAYVAQPSYVDESLTPFTWYCAVVRAGARQHRLPSEYRSSLGPSSTRPDPNEDRRAKYRSLLAQAGFADVWAQT